MKAKNNISVQLQEHEHIGSSESVKWLTVEMVECLLPVGSEARRVFDEAQQLLNQMIDSGSLKGRGLVGFWPAQSDGDDISVYKDDVTVNRDTKPIATFHGLRQQVSCINSCSICHFIALNPSVCQTQVHTPTSQQQPWLLVMLLWSTGLLNVLSLSVMSFLVVVFFWQLPQHKGNFQKDT